jgi:hypothetical protein
MSYGDNSSYGSGSPGGGGQVNGTLILVLGILGIVLCQLLGPVAWIMGNSATRAVGGDPQQLNLANIGRVLGIIGTVILILGIVSFIFFGGAILALLNSAANNPPRSSM